MRKDPGPGEQLYTVRGDEKLFQIAERFGTTLTGLSAVTTCKTVSLVAAPSSFQLASCNYSRLEPCDIGRRAFFN